MINETTIDEDILSLLVYLCELTIDGDTTEPPQNQTITDIDHVVSSEAFIQTENQDVKDDNNIKTKNKLESLNELEQCYGLRVS